LAYEKLEIKNHFRLRNLGVSRFAWRNDAGGRSAGAAVSAFTSAFA
jgi:hypothetical protein